MRQVYLSALISWLTITVLPAQYHAPTIPSLESRYADFKNESILTKRFTIEELVPIFEEHHRKGKLKFKTAAHSIQRRPIYLAKYGQGPTPVLFWSQMHGDESTATMALLDLFKYLESDQAEDQVFLKAIRNRFTLYFIPMLNPDGADQFQRRNAASIDLNRDAIHRSNPESRLLKAVRDSLRPVFGFNLHDQSIYYRAGIEGKQVAMAFLAPAFDYEKSINGVRMKSMQLISILHDSLSQVIPDRIAVYDDSFEPRAFGDNIQKWGTSAILIESGGYPDDPEKQYLRQLNFITYIKALESMLTSSYESKTIGEYQAIPENDRKMMSLIIRQLEVPVEQQTIRMDIGYQYESSLTDGQRQTISRLTDVGDLRVYTGFEEMDAEGMHIIQPKWYGSSGSSLRDLKVRDWRPLIEAGYLGFLVDSNVDLPAHLPLHFTDTIPKKKANPFYPAFHPGANPTFILANDQQRYIVKNGEVFTLDEVVAQLNQYFK